MTDPEKQLPENSRARRIGGTIAGLVLVAVGMVASVAGIRGPQQDSVEPFDSPGYIPPDPEEYRQTAPAPEKAQPTPSEYIPPASPPLKPYWQDQIQEDRYVEESITI